MGKAGRGALMFLMWGGLVLGLALTVLSGRNIEEDDGAPTASTVPTIRVVPSTVSAGETVPLHITLSSTGWQYGYTAKLQQLVGQDWKFRYTLFLGMGPPEFKPGYSKDRSPLVMAIAFGGNGEAQIKTPPLDSGRYRIRMGFWGRRDIRHVAYADLEVH